MLTKVNIGLAGLVLLLGVVGLVAGAPGSLGYTGISVSALMGWSVVLNYENRLGLK